MRTNNKLILHKLLSLVLAVTMVGSLLVTPAMAADEHDHSEDYNLDEMISGFTVEDFTKHDCASGVGCTYDADGHMNCAETYALKADSSYVHDCSSGVGCTYDADGHMNCGTFYEESTCSGEGCTYDENGNMTCCDGGENASIAAGGCCDSTAPVAEEGAFVKAINTITSFFDMSDVGVVAYAANCNYTGINCTCAPNGACNSSCTSTGTSVAPWCHGGKYNALTGGSVGTPSTGTGTGSSGGSTTNNYTTNNYYTKCPFCGSSSTHNKQCPTVASWFATECAYCRSTSHTMANCPTYKATLPTDVKSCHDCGVVESAKINGVVWTFTHAVSCPIYKDFWEDTIDEPTIENKGSDGVYINGQLVAGTNFNPALIGTGGGGVTKDNDQGFGNRVSATTSKEATVLTYPRTLSDLTNRVGTNFYDDANWKTIIGASGGKSYTTDTSGIWTYGGNKYRIAKVPQATDARAYVLVRLPSDWDSRLVEVNPKAQGNVATPSGSTTTRTTTTTSTSTSKSTPNSTTNNNSSVTFGSYKQDTKTGTSYNSTASAAANAGIKINDKGVVTNNNVTKGGTTYSVKTDSKGKPIKDSKGNLQITATSKKTSTSTHTVSVHHCSYSYYYTDVCKTGSVTFTGSWAYNKGNSGTMSSTGANNVWDTGSGLITGNSPNKDSGFSYVKKDPYSSIISGSSTGVSTALKKPSYSYTDNYNKYQATLQPNVNTSNTVSANGSSSHVKTTFSCCSSNCGSVTEPHNYTKTTYTDAGTDLHRVERICGDCGHIEVSYAAHTTSAEKCPSCGREMGKWISWHWYNSAEGPVITKIWQSYYTILKYPATRGRQDYTFTGWYTDWGGVGQMLDPDVETLYVHVMPADFYAAWAFIIQHDFTAPTISATFFTSEAEAKKKNGKPITDMDKPVEEMWVRIDSIDLEGHSVEAHKQYVGQSSTKDKNGTAHYSWHKDNPLWTSGLIPDVEDWVGSLQLSGEGDVWHESPYIVKVTRNEPLTIIARDAWANTRSHTITITNFDDGAPVIEGFTQSNDSWTNQPVRVNVIAHDDQALAEQAYKWDYTLNSEGNAIVHPGQWTSMPYFDMPDAGRVRVTVKDAVGKETKSGTDTTAGQPPVDWYAVSNIDKIPLSLSSTTAYTLSTQELIAAVTGVTITLNIVDPTDSVTGMSSGLAPTAIKWEGLTDWTTAKTVTVHRNGTYTVQLRDAVGNTSSFDIPITNIVTQGPSVSLSGTDVDGHSITSETWWKGPVTLNAFASMGQAGARPDGMTYSWDGGQTWTTQSTFVATTNGTYTVTVRDKSGTTASAVIYLGHLDNTAPVAGMYLYKGQPDDWNQRFPGKTCTEADYVWKLRIEIEDPGSTLTEGNPSLGSGLYSIQYQWLGNRVVKMANVTTEDRNILGGTITSSTTNYTHIFDVPQPGTYQITVIDNAGNAVQVEKVAQWTDLGESVDGPNPNVPITLPDTGGGPSGNDHTQHGTAGLPYDANIEDLIFGEDGAYNVVTGTFTPYPNGQKGIPINFQAEITRNRWGTGYVTYNNIKYTVTFSNPDSNGLNTTLGSFGSVANAKVLGTGNKINCYAFIPLTAFHNDVKNARIYVTINEWDDEACTQLLKTGTENLYTSVQKTHPTLTYTYNRVTDTMTVVATSALAGIKKVEYKYNTGSWTDYTGPFVIGEPKPTTITLRATDNLGYETELEINVADLGLNGSSGGVGSLPQDTMTDDSSTSSYHSSNRAADIYIIGGTRGNTDQHPSGTVFDRLLG